MKPSTNYSFKGRTIRCLLFDLGDTLWTSVDKVTMEQIIRSRNQTIAELLPAYFPTHAAGSMDYTQISAQLRIAIGQRYVYWSRQVYDAEPDPYVVTTEACQLLHLPDLDREQKLALHEAYRMSYNETRRLFDDTLETLSELRRRGFILGCVTDRQYGGAPFLADLQACRLLSYFPLEAIVVSADCGKRKPHPSLFTQALTALKVAPEETAMVGDYLCRDVAGAKRLNMLAIWKPKTRLFREAQISHNTIDTQDRDSYLLAYAHEQEMAREPKFPFNEFKPFMEPDATIKDVSELLTLFYSISGNA